VSIIVGYNVSDLANPIDLTDERTALTSMLDRLPCGKRMAQAWACWILSEPELIEQLGLSESERRAAENWVWAHRLG
jgi:hypothetical protein